MKYTGILLLLIIDLYIFISCATQRPKTENISIGKPDTLKRKAEAKPESTGEEKTVTVKPAADEYYTKDFMRYEDYIYMPNIKTIQAYREGFELSPPMFDLNTTDRLIFSFDDLDGKVKNYKYYIIHCDADWQPSSISDYEFQRGFSDNFINNYKYSFNTRQKYVHYNFVFPNENIQVITSGNYLMVVYEEERENVAFTKRFWVAETKVTVNASEQRATRLEERNYRQEIDFSINKNAYEILNPYTDLKVKIMQNERTDNMMMDIKPQVVKDNIIDYNFNGEITFDGGSEFRNFNIKSIKYNSERVRNISVDSVTDKFVVTLYPDIRRPFQQYLSDKDINGRFLIRSEDNVTDSNVEGEYVWVKFTLPYNTPLADGEIYVMGTLAQWQFGRDNKMTYDYSQKAYSAMLFLKQGYYNYEYIFLPNGAKSGDVSFIEGNHYETENVYTIFVYNREAGTTFDKLIGLKQINSMGF